MEIQEALTVAAATVKTHGDNHTVMLSEDGSGLMFRATSSLTYVRPERTVLLDGITEQAITDAVQANALDIANGPAAPLNADIPPAIENPALPDADPSNS